MTQTRVFTTDTITAEELANGETTVARPVDTSVESRMRSRMHDPLIETKGRKSFRVIESICEERGTRERIRPRINGKNAAKNEMQTTWFVSMLSGPGDRAFSQRVLFSPSTFLSVALSVSLSLSLSLSLFLSFSCAVTRKIIHARKVHNGWARILDETREDERT